ncbi:TPA: hypothetical protein ACKP9G_003723 [Pseudomonas aeruginosa]
MKITNVEWSEGAPDKLEPGMLIRAMFCDEEYTYLVGTSLDDGSTIGDEGAVIGLQHITRWAWLIQPHELAWLENMANKHKARARG